MWGSCSGLWDCGGGGGLSLGCGGGGGRGIGAVLTQHIPSASQWAFHRGSTLAGARAAGHSGLVQRAAETCEAPRGGGESRAVDGLAEWGQTSRTFPSTPSVVTASDLGEPIAEGLKTGVPIDVPAAAGADSATFASADGGARRRKAESADGGVGASGGWASGGGKVSARTINASSSGSNGAVNPEAGGSEIVAVQGVHGIQRTVDSCGLCGGRRWSNSGRSRTLGLGGRGRVLSCGRRRGRGWCSCFIAHTSLGNSIPSATQRALGGRCSNALAREAGVRRSIEGASQHHGATRRSAALRAGNEIAGGSSCVPSAPGVVAALEDVEPCADLVHARATSGVPDAARSVSTGHVSETAAGWCNALLVDRGTR